MKTMPVGAWRRIRVAAAVLSFGIVCVEAHAAAVFMQAGAQGNVASQSISSTIAGETVSALGLSTVSSRDGCIPKPGQDNQALSFATASADYGQVKIKAGVEGDKAFLAHNGPQPPAGECDFSVTGIVTSAGASAGFSDGLTIISKSGAVGYVDMKVRGHWDAILDSTSFRGMNFGASMTLAGAYLFNDTAASAPQTINADGDIVFGRDFEQVISVAIGDLLDLTSQFAVGLSASGLACSSNPSSACTQVVIFDGTSTLQITDFSLPDGFELASSSGQISRYGDHFAYVAVGGDVPQNQVAEPGSLLLVLLALVLAMAHRHAMRPKLAE